jgi:hypothetical protein
VGTIVKLILAVIVLFVLIIGYQLKQAGKGDFAGSMWADGKNTKECFEEGLRLMQENDSRFNHMYVSTFTAGCMDNARRHDRLCTILPKMDADIAASNQRRCEAMALGTGPCVAMLKVYGRYCP